MNRYGFSLKNISDIFCILTACSLNTSCRSWPVTGNLVALRLRSIKTLRAVLVAQVRFLRLMKLLQLALVILNN